MLTFLLHCMFLALGLLCLFLFFSFFFLRKSHRGPLSPPIQGSPICHLSLLGPWLSH